MDWRDFTLADAVAAEESLSTFAPTVREKGDEAFRRGIIQNIRCLDAHSSYAGSVTGLRPCEVALRFDSTSARWRPDCTCPTGPQCEHTYALTRHLLTRHQLIAGNTPKPAARKVSTRKTATAAEAPAVPASSRSTASGTPTPSTTPGRNPAPAAVPTSPVSTALPAKPGPLEERLIGRQITLTDTHRALLSQISDLYRRFGRRPAIPKLELERLGLSKPSGNTGNFDGVQLWRSLPTDEYDFWLYVALHAEEKGPGIPAFLKPISDLEPLRRRLAHERRQQEIEHWRQVLATWGAPPTEEAATPGATDLRIRFSEAEAILEWRRNPTEEFEVMKAHQFERFSQTHIGRGLVAPEGTLLWHAFQQCLVVNGYKKPALNAAEPNSRRTLAFLLRQPGLANRLVNAEGEPLARPLAPLRWQLIPPDEIQGDYRLRLVQPDGTPAPAIHATFPGEPTLFLASEAIFAGPPVDDRLLALNTETTVPAAAVESRGGVRFLRNLGLDLPPRLVDRVRLIPLKPLLRLDLRQLTHGSDAEHCTMEVLGISADATLVERWNGSQWQEPPGAKPVESTTAPGGDQIVSVDRTGLAGIAAHIESGGFRWDFARHAWTLRVTRMFPEKFVPWLQSLPKDLSIELRGELGSFLNAEVSGRVRLAVSEGDSIDWFDLRVVLDVNDTSLTKEELKLLLDARGRWVRLTNKGWRRLDFQLTAAEDEQLARLGLSPHEISAESQRLHVLQIDPEAAAGLLPEETLLRIRIRTQEIRTRVHPAQPASVHAELRPYQLEGFHYLAYLATNGFGGVLADDMGLGKTLQTLTWIAWLRDETVAGRIATRATPGAKARKTKSNAAAPILVVCPKSVCDNWRAEAERFTPHLRTRAWRGTELDHMPGRLAEADIHILNYNQLRGIGETLAEHQFLAVVLDEGQYIKNPSSVTALIAKTLRADHRLVLSGTPIENRLLDLWSLMSFAMPGLLGTRNGFQKQFDSAQDPLARRRLSARIRPFLLRRTKSQVARDLPDRIEEDLFCELEGDQLSLYRAELKRAQQLLLRVGSAKQLQQERFNLLTSLLRLRQICCHPKLIQPDSTAPSAKVEALIEQLEPLMEEGQKVLVFSQFVSLLELLQSEMHARQWNTFFLAGETEDRGALVREFQAAEGNAVFLISLKAGGFGLNLTAASYVVLFDPWWNPAVEAQAIDRSHRIGQTQKVIAYRLLIKDSLEEKIRALQKTKKALADDVLGEESFANNLSLEDFQFLFND
jgi:hypothetical protein